MQLGGRTSLTVRLTVLFAAASSAVLLLLGYLIANAVDLFLNFLCPYFTIFGRNGQELTAQKFLWCGGLINIDMGAFCTNYGMERFC